MSRIKVILIAILIIQLGVWALISTSRNIVTEKKKFLSLDTTSIDYIHIKNKDGEITLKRMGGIWKITDPYDYPANPSYIETLLKKVQALEYESLITSNKDKYENYEVDGEEASYIEIGKEGDVVDKFYCGKPSKNYTHTYLRPADKDEIWLVAGTPRSSFTRNPKDWRDKKILRLDKTMMERILLKFPDETVELTRSISMPDMDTTLTEPDTSWTVIPKRGKPFKPADNVLNRIRNTLSRMNATDFMVKGEDEIPSFDKPDFTVEVFLEGDQHEVIDFVPNPEDDKKFIARKNNSDETVFVVYQSSVNNLKKRPEDLKEKEEDKET